MAWLHGQDSNLRLSSVNSRVPFRLATVQCGGQSLARHATSDHLCVRREHAIHFERVSSPVGLSKSACPRERRHCGSGSRICTYANGFRARYPAIGPSRNGWSGSSGNRTLTDRLRADCSALELKTLGGSEGVAPSSLGLKARCLVYSTTSPPVISFWQR